jgi:Domain of unknown function (DUF1830)
MVASVTKPPRERVGRWVNLWSCPLDRVDLLPQQDGLPTTLDCGYRNASDRMVILRCCGPGEFYLERVVFPFELLSFLCPGTSRVEIWTHGLGGPELVETLPAEELLIESPTAATAPHLPFGETPWLEAG